ncbi:hypothetical protein BBJ28_00005025 [Nothophytophthora sp. Chile5]|nr:hypothetical protein BBJ28_00005025 [Nothophytophthora sp. Chile5]
MSRTEASMSFLAEEESMATLEEVVAFIDGFDGDDISISDVTTSGSESGGSPFAYDDVKIELLDVPNVTLDRASLLPREEAEKPQPPAKPKKRRAPGSSTRLQRRKKAEILALREEAQDLEAELRQMKRMGESAKSRWFATASAQYQERLRSEKTNRKLRAIYADQAAVSESFRQLLQKQPVLYVRTCGMDYVFKTPTPTARHPLADIDDSVLVMSELEAMVEGLYLDSSSVFRSKVLPSISSNLMVRDDIRRGKTVEITTTTPMSCSMEAAGALLWKDLTTQREYVDKTIRFVRLHVGFTQSATPIDGLAFTRKFEEPNRIALVMAQQMLLPAEALSIGMHSWTVVTRSEVEPQRASIVRSVLRIYAESRGGFSAQESDLRAAEEIVLGQHASTMSFEIEGDGMMATLEEVFAFIDSCDGLEDSPTASSSGCDAVSDNGSESLVTDKNASQNAPPTFESAPGSSDGQRVEKAQRPKRRKRGSWTSSAGLQRRKKAELLHLRELVQVLEDQLQQMAPRSEAQLATTKWRALAMGEYLKRQQAEKTNRTLKLIMNHQLQVSETIGELL